MALKIGDKVDTRLAEHAAPEPTGNDRRKAALSQVEACVCRDRQNSYGDAEDNFKDISVLVEMYLRKQGKLALDATIDALDIAIVMQAVKYCRACTSREHFDNQIDMAGYAVCAAGILDKMKAGTDQ